MTKNEYLKDAISIALSVKELTSVIIDSGITPDEMNYLSMLKPDLNDTIDTIKKWIDNDGPVVPDEPVTHYEYDPVISEPVELLPPVPEPIPEPTAPDDEKTKPSTSEYVKMDKDICIQICKWIATHCNDLTIVEASSLTSNEFPNIRSRTIMRLIKGATYLKTSAEYFSIANGVVQSNYTPDAGPEDEGEEIPFNIPNREVFDKVIKDIPSEVWIPVAKDLIAYGSVKRYLETLVATRKITNEDITKEDCITAVDVESALVKSGTKIAFLEEFTVSIMISDAVARVGKKKTARITNYIVKRWGVDPKHPHIYAVINKKIDSWISDLFFK